MGLPTPVQREYLSSALAQISALLRQAVERDALHTPIRHCPDWDIARLVGHLGDVHRWAITGIREGHGERDSRAPEDASFLIAWFEDGAADLLDALDGPADRPVWSFAPPAVLGFWQRRMVHEHVVHLVDLELALDRPLSAIDPAVAADGIGEVLEVFIPRRLGDGRLGPLPYAVQLNAAEGGTWTLGPGSGTDSGTGPDETPVAQLDGPAQALYLMVWKRIPLTAQELRWTGDQDAGRRVLAMPISS